MSCVAAQIVRFTDDPAFSIFWGPPGIIGARGATGNNKTNFKKFPRVVMLEVSLFACLCKLIHVEQKYLVANGRTIYAAICWDMRWMKPKKCGEV